MTHQVVINPDRPIRSFLRSLGVYRRPLITAAFIFILKDSPVWVMPVITSAVIDVVVARGPLERLILLGIAALIVLGQNFPTQILVTSQPNRQQTLRCLLAYGRTS